MLASDRLERGGPYPQANELNLWSVTVLGSILASSDTVESEGLQLKQCWIQYWKKATKNPPFKGVVKRNLEYRYTLHYSLQYSS
jgi:hypothetical protein